MIYYFFFNDTATTEIYTLSLHDALPICPERPMWPCARQATARTGSARPRSEEHTSELQSHSDLVCRLLLEKKKTISIQYHDVSRRSSRGVTRGGTEEYLYRLRLEPACQC